MNSTGLKSARPLTGEFFFDKYVLWYYKSHRLVESADVEPQIRKADYRAFAHQCFVPFLFPCFVFIVCCPSPFLLFNMLRYLSTVMWGSLIRNLLAAFERARKNVDYLSYKQIKDMLA